MKVLQIYKDYDPPVKGGIEGHLNLLANGLKQSGMTVEVLVSNTKPYSEQENIDGIPVTKAAEFGRLNSAPFNPTLPHWIRKLGEDADIHHFHFPNPTAEFSCLISGLKPNIVVTYHSDIVRQKIMGKLYSPVMAKFLQRARTIIVSSPNYLQSSKVLANFKDKCRVIPFGIDLKYFKCDPALSESIAAIRQRYPGPRVLFIGKFRYYKGLHVLVEAMTHTVAQLLLIGSGPFEKKLRHQVKQGRLEDKVVFLGAVSERQKLAYLHACDLFVLPSIFRSEAFGIAQLEAMACGKPVISTELSTGTSFVNQHGKTGLVVAPDDVAAMAQAINYLLKNRDVRERFGKTGLEHATNYYARERMIEDVIKIYEEMLA